MVVVLASKGFGDYPKGEKITTPEKLQDSTILIHAGTTSDDYGNVISSGGRVLGAVGMVLHWKMRRKLRTPCANPLNFHPNIS